MPALSDILPDSSPLVLGTIFVRNGVPRLGEHTL